MLNKLKGLKNEDGVIAVIFAIFMSFAVVGLLSLVVDVSELYAERRVVQSAADASVLAITQECAIGGTGAINAGAAYPSSVCANQSYAQEFASAYANLNSPDLLTDVSEVCGQTPLKACDPLTSGKYECRSVDSKFRNYVRIKTSTRQSSGAEIKSIFEPLMGSNANSKVVGCAQAAWGNAASAPVVMPIALSICEWQLNGTKLLMDYVSKDATVKGGCPFTDLDGKLIDVPSPTKGFSLISKLDCTNNSSTKYTQVGDELAGESSITQVWSSCAGGENEFRTKLASLRNTTIFLPLVTSVICTSSTNDQCKGSYKFKVAAFFGFKYLGSKWANRIIDGANPGSSWPAECDSDRVCLYGTFERSVVPGVDVSLSPGIPALGAMAVQLLP